MVDQVNPTGSLVPGTSPVLMTASKIKPVPDKSPPPKAAKIQLKELAPPNLEASPKEAEEAVKDLNDFLKQSGSELTLLRDTSKEAMSYSDLMFQVDDSTGLSFFKIVDSKTREIIRQVPSEEVLAMARKLRELSGHKDAAGVLVDQEG